MEAVEAAEQVAIRLKDLPRRVLDPKVPALKGKGGGRGTKGSGGKGGRGTPGATRMNKVELKQDEKAQMLAIKNRDDYMHATTDDLRKSCICRRNNVLTVDILVM